MHQLLLKPFKTILRWICQVPPYPDPWEKDKAGVNWKIGVNFFRKDIPIDFRYFFQRNLSSNVRSLDEICDWLRQCKYISDQEQFHQKDHWQHPCDFEQSRQGDCEDHALWAWRKLVELGFEAEFVIGKKHAWVHFIKDGEPFLFETASKEPLMWQPINEVKDRYTPYWGIDRKFQQFLFGGILENLRD